MKFKARINDAIFLFPVIVMGLIFLFKTFQLAEILRFFPGSDYPVYILRLFSLEHYGYNGIFPNWYGGWLPFLHYGPAYFFFALGLYKLTGSLMHGFYLSIIGNYIIGFIGVALIGAAVRWGWLKRIFLFLMFYATPITIVWFNEMGRIPEMFAWSVLLVFIALLLYYKERLLDLKFIIGYSLLFGILLISHVSVFIIAAILCAGLFLVKPFREKLYMALGALITALITAFWWVPFFRAYSSALIDEWVPISFMLFTPTERLYAIVIPIAFFVVFYLYMRERHWDKKELLFYAPLVLSALLVITALGIYVPIFNKVHSRLYVIVLLTMMTILFINLKPNHRKLKYAAILGIPILVLAAVALRYPTMDFPLYRDDSKAVAELFPYVNGDLSIACPELGRANIGMLYSYGAIYGNISTPFGYFGQGETAELKEARQKLYDATSGHDCEKAKETISWLQTPGIISCGQHCGFYEECGFELQQTIRNVCLLKV